MAYEIDFLAVGDNGKSGDAIALRFGDLTNAGNQQAVVVIDGGFCDTGKLLLDHIDTYYETKRIDLVICTHPDGDHSAGLKYVLENAQVGRLWMHQPWKHTQGIAELFKDGRVSDQSVREELRKSLDDAMELERIALRRQIPIEEPFAGVTTSGFGTTIRILGPSQQYYESLIPGFRCTPESLKPQGVIAKAAEGVIELVAKIAETWDIETLKDTGETSPENNSSAVVLVTCGEDNLLFTGDAGIPALELASDQLASLGVLPGQLKFIQVPHHGSQRNVGPKLLDRLLGGRQSTETKIRTAFVSAAKDGKPKHPSKRVLNAFRRRGTWVHGTDDGNPRCHFSVGAPPRAWGASTPHPFYSEVED